MQYPAVAADTVWLEPTWLNTRHLRVGNGTPQHRLLHFTDLHHKGDTKYLKSVIAHINAQKPDFVCFTGDLVEEEKFLAETLKYLAGIKVPLFGVPGTMITGAKFPLSRSESVSRPPAATGCSMSNIEFPAADSTSSASRATTPRK